MKCHGLYTGLLLLAFAGGAFGQEQPVVARIGDAPIPDDVKARFTPMIEERVSFFGKHYQLGESAMAKLRGELERLIGEQAIYSGRWDATLRRRNLALSRTLPANTEISEALKNRLMQKYQEEIYDIHLKSPMGYANVARRVESGMSTEAIAAAHQRLATAFADRLQGQPIKTEQLDRVVLGPVQPLLSTPDPLERALNPNAAPRPAKIDPATRQTALTAPQQPLGPPPPPRADVPPEKVQLEPAPAVDAWQPKLDELMDYYRFDEKQRASAAGVLSSCTKRANDHLTSNAEAYEKAKAISDEAERSKALGELNQKVDGLYNEFRRRVDSIATLQQKAEAAARDKSAGAEPNS